EQATSLVPWMPSPRAMAAQAALQVSQRESDRARRAATRQEAEMLLATRRGGTAVSADVWRIRGQIALARAQDGERQQLAGAMAALARADRLRAHDSGILRSWAVALLMDGRNSEAREMAERLVRVNDEDWAAWFVIGRASALLGDQQRRQKAEDSLWGRVPPE